MLDRRFTSCFVKASTVKGMPMLLSHRLVHDEVHFPVSANNGLLRMSGFRLFYTLTVPLVCSALHVTSLDFHFS